MADWQQRRRVSLKLGVSVIKISTHVIMRIYASDALQYLGMPNLSAGLALAPAQRVSFFVPGHLTATACWCAPPMATAPSPPLPMESTEMFSLENCWFLRMRRRSGIGTFLFLIIDWSWSFGLWCLLEVGLVNSYFGAGYLKLILGLILLQNELQQLGTNWSEMANESVQCGKEMATFDTWPTLPFNQ